MRVSWFGGGSDIKLFLDEGERSIVVGSAINKYVTIAIKELNNIFDYKIRLSYSIIECVKNINELKHQTIKHVLNKYNIDKNLDIHIITDLPKTGGIGSSSSFITCLIKSLNTLNGIHWGRKEIAKEAINIERNEMGLDGGYQDQIFASYGGGVSKIEFVNGDFFIEPVVCGRPFIEHLQEHIILFHTGQDRLSGEVAKSYTKKSIDSLRSIRDIAIESLEYFASENINQIGKLLNLSWQSKRAISDKISNDRVDSIISTGLSSGAIGAKIMGAGQDGFILFLCPPHRQDHLCDKLSGLKSVKCKFDYQGTTTIFSE
jgi:D-glycero-alpha-D-manno-heptose-7-phosphate kinase